MRIGHRTSAGRFGPLALLFARGESGNHDLIALIPGNPSLRSSILFHGKEDLVEVPLGPLNTSRDEG
jgi:hypothetical protein